jgi:hypothetical protein
MVKAQKAKDANAKQHVTEMALSNTSALSCKFVVCHFPSFSHG